MKLFETRHLTGPKSNFGIVNRKSCLLHSVSHENQPLSHAIITNAKALVEAQCFLFDTLWNNAISAQEKIREIEEGVKPPFTQTLRDPHQIQKLVFDLASSSKQEILMLLFPNTAIGDIFLEGYEQEHIIQKIIQLLEEAITQNGIRVRILVSKDIYKQIEKLIAIQQKIITERRQEAERQQKGRRGLVGIGKQERRFEIHLADTTQQQQQQQRLQTKVSFLVVDSKVSLVEEEPKAYDKDSNNPNEKISLATFSNSESTILAYTSIFEKLWAQTELKIKM